MVGRRGFVQELGVVAGAAALAGAQVGKRAISLHDSFGEHCLLGAFEFLGAIAMKMRAPDGTTYQVDVLARSRRGGLRDTRKYSLFLANRGDGRTDTLEMHGLGLMAIAAWLDANDPSLPDLLTFEQRAAAHPSGNFLV